MVNPGFVETPLTAQNDFAMPALITPEQAAHEILARLGGRALRDPLPEALHAVAEGAAATCRDALYFPAVRRVTGL